MKNEETLKYLALLPPNLDHLAIGLHIKNRFRIFDPSIFESEASHDPFYTLTLRQYLAFDLSSLASSFSQEKQFTKAVQLIEEAKTIDPVSSMVHANECSLWNRQKNWNHATISCNKAIELNPNEAIAFVNRAYTREQQADITGAINDYSTVLSK